MRSFKVVEFNAPLTEVNAATPQPSGTQVLLRVKAAGVCHSDLHIWEGGYELGHGRKPLSLKDRGVSLPLTMGHETVGEVVALGPEATGVAVGEVRLVYPWLGCGKCETCLAGDENMCAVKSNSLGVFCDGGYADHIMVPHPRYLIDLKGLDPVTAAPYACSGVTTYSALATVDGTAPDALQQIMARAGGPIRGAIDLVGNSATASLGFDCLSKGGKLVMVGLFGGGAPWALPLIPMKAITIQGSYVGSLGEIRDLIDLVRAKNIPPIPVTTRPLAQVDAALNELKQGKLVGRAVLLP